MDLLGIKPNQVSTNVNAYKILVYGDNKTGKTTLASQIPNCLLLGFEKGFDAIAGILAQPINKWSEFREVYKAFKNDEEVRNKFKCIAIDTIDYATVMCEKYICSQLNIDDLSKAPFGKAYKAVQDEFMSVINGFIDLGVGVLVISHAENVLVGEIPSKDGTDTIKVYRKEPTIGNKKIKKFILDAMDITGYITSELKEDGTYDAKLHLRETKDYMAGNHFRYLDSEISFNYDALQNAIIAAVKKEAESKGQETTTEIKREVKVQKDFNELIVEFNDLVKSIPGASGADASTEAGKNFKTNIAPQITDIVERHLGKGAKINTATRNQIEAVEATVIDLRELVENLQR